VQPDQSKAKVWVKNPGGAIINAYPRHGDAVFTHKPEAF
jgi:hypothetical protein